FGAALPVRKQNRDRNAVAYLVESVGEEHGPRVAFPDLAIPEGVQIQEAFLLPCGELSAHVAGLPGCGSRASRGWRPRSRHPRSASAPPSRPPPPSSEVQPAQILSISP